MNCLRSFRLAMVALVPAAAISLGLGHALAQSPPAAPPAASTPSTPAPAIRHARPGAAGNPGPAAHRQRLPRRRQPRDPRDTARRRAGPDRRSVRRRNHAGRRRRSSILKGSANWDSAFDTLIDSFKTLSALLDKQGIKPAGNPMIVYTSTDDTGFTFLAEIPVDQEPKNLTKDMSIGKSPEGKALKFVHRGSYDNMDNTYEAITNHLDDKKLEAKDTFIEEYITDPLKTAEDKLVINVYVPLK